MCERKISVIVPVYMVENYIDDCIESIVNQTYRNLEIILVDDGSRDKCGFICDEWAKKDSRIIVIHKQNGGLSDARNAGIDIATGELLGFVDSDDHISPVFYETLAGLLEKYDLLVAECGCVRFEDGDKNPEQREEKKEIKLLSAREWLTETNLKDFLPMVAWNKLYDKRLFEKIRYPFGRIYEDEATTYKLVYQAGSIVRTYSRLYYYRQRENSIIFRYKKNKKSMEHSLLAYKERAEFFEKENEKEMANFAKAKYCMGLCEKLRKCKFLYQENIKDIKKQTRNEIKTIYRTFRWDGSVPIKYKLYISVVKCASYFFW